LQDVLPLLSLLQGNPTVTLRTIGPKLFAKDGKGRLLSRIATVFPKDGVLVTLPGIHFVQREAYVSQRDQERQEQGLPPLSLEEKDACRDGAVSLFVDDGAVQIRPDPDNMTLAFAADEVLQSVIPKSNIRFLNALNPKVRDAVKRRGECWRITPLPKSTGEMVQMIRDARSGIGGRDIYHYSRATGTRWLTCGQFSRFGAFPEDELRRHLLEIQRYSCCWNSQGSREVDFFLAARSFRDRLAEFNFSTLDADGLRQAHRSLLEEFVREIPCELRRDDVQHAQWRRRMFAVLVPNGDDVASEEELLGLGAEFFMQIEWLPGGRIENGELILDSVGDESPSPRGEAESPALDHSQARSLLFDLVREYGNLEYINLGRISVSMARRPGTGGRRGVFVVEMKRRDSKEETLKIIRMQKWGVREHLDDKCPLLDALLKSEEYTEYTLDRRLGCRQLGMNLPAQVVTRKMGETYFGKQKSLWTMRIWSPYFERDYVRGISTDIVPLCRFEDPEFAVRFASVLGRAAAPNIIVGRQSSKGVVIFDNGDEVLIEDEDGLPADIVVTDHTGAFIAFDEDIYQLASMHTLPVSGRLAHVPNPAEFTSAYVNACLANFARIQQKYRRRRRAFDGLFADRIRDEQGSLAYRWERVLERLDRTNLDKLESVLREKIASEAAERRWDTSPKDDRPAPKALGRRRREASDADDIA
jgi:hypothetical protein